MTDNVVSRRYVFTINNPTEEDKTSVISTMEDRKLTVYGVFGYERGQEGTLHIQGFIVFSRSVRFKRAVKLLGGRCYLAVARGTSLEASEYCKKDDSWEEFGECPEDTRLSSESQLAVWDEARRLACEGRFDEIRSDMYIRYRNSFHSIYEEKLVAKECLSELDNTWIIGQTGIGKSRWCFSKYPDAYRKALNKWWDHYTNESVVIIEDVDPGHGAWMGAYLKLWGDHYPFIAERKGGSRQIRPRKIVVTSNYMPQHVFTDPGIHVPLLRRFSLKTIENGVLVPYVPIVAPIASPSQIPWAPGLHRIGVNHWSEVR